LYLEGQPITARYTTLREIWSVAFIHRKHTLDITKDSITLKGGYEIRESNPSV
jgi:hypothetical protein